MAKAKRHSSVPALVKCIRSGGEKDSVLTEMCDEMLALTARTLGDINATDKQLEDIIKHISNRTIKVRIDPLIYFCDLFFLFSFRLIRTSRLNS